MERPAESGSATAAARWHRAGHRARGDGGRNDERQRFPAQRGAQSGGQFPVRVARGLQHGVGGHGGGERGAFGRIGDFAEHQGEESRIVRREERGS